MADLVIVGAGPAGIGAAAEATQAGLSVILIDAWDEPGGQIYAKSAGSTFSDLPAEVTAGLRLDLVEARFGEEVWGAFDRGRILGLRRGDAAYELRADHLVIATGAAERVCPFPGWDDPAVLSAGGAQRLLKTAGMVPDGRVLIAGSGPFLRTVCADLVEAGAEVVGLLEERQRRQLATLAIAFARQPTRAAEASRYIRRTRQVHVRFGVGVVAYRDGSALLSDGTRVACETLLVGSGFRPRSELARLADCAVTAAGTITNDLQATSNDGIWAAGEVTGIGGALLASVEGRIAGAAAARSCGANITDQHLARLQSDRERHRYFARALWRAWPTADVLGRTDPSTTVCRCESVVLADLRAAMDRTDLASGRAAKALLRCGMGACQGATCGESVRAVTGRGQDLDERWEPRVRPPIAPVTIGALAEMEVIER